MSERISTSPYSVTQGLWVTDLVILNYDQVTRTTPELVPPSPNFHTTPMEGRLNSDRFNVHQLLCTAGLERLQVRTHDTPATSP
ncbi:hypothetical protein TNCV_2654751 [Trichonephila clavipes]|nr:hypothetical protein TNCV_2654751 [Trichonephila clavipes]